MAESPGRAQGRCNLFGLGPFSASACGRASPSFSNSGAAFARNRRVASFMAALTTRWSALARKPGRRIDQRGATADVFEPTHTRSPATLFRALRMLLPQIARNRRSPNRNRTKLRIRALGQEKSFRNLILNQHPPLLEIFRDRTCAAESRARRLPKMRPIFGFHKGFRRAWIRRRWLRLRRLFCRSQYA